MLSAIEDRVITMDVEEAREQLEAYRAELDRRADAEYEAIATGLEELIEGRRLVDVRNAIVAGGFHEDGRPRIAIARADRKQVRCNWNTRGRILTLRTDGRSGQASPRARPSMSHTITLHDGEHPEWKHWRDADNWPHSNIPGTGYALVPIIPPAVRREAGVAASRDREHHVLFEVEAWSDTPLRAEPDRDPYLLRHLGGDLYVILAAWDLTPLERAVMTWRRDDGDWPGASQWVSRSPAD